MNRSVSLVGVALLILAGFPASADDNTQNSRKARNVSGVSGIAVPSTAPAIAPLQAVTPVPQVAVPPAGAAVVPTAPVIMPTDAVVMPIDPARMPGTSGHDPQNASQP